MADNGKGEAYHSLNSSNGHAASPGGSSSASDFSPNGVSGYSSSTPSPVGPILIIAFFAALISGGFTALVTEHKTQLWAPFVAAAIGAGLTMVVSACCCIKNGY